MHASFYCCFAVRSYISLWEVIFFAVRKVIFRLCRSYIESLCASVIFLAVREVIFRLRRSYIESLCASVIFFAMRKVILYSPSNFKLPLGNITAEGNITRRQANIVARHAPCSPLGEYSCVAPLGATLNTSRPCRPEEASSEA